MLHISTIIQKYRWLLILIITGFLFRIAISFITYSGDVNNHIAWAKDLVTVGPQGMYERDFSHRYGTMYANYPPLTLYFFAFMYLVYTWLQVTIGFLNTTVPIFPSKLVFFMQTPNILPAFLKFPAIVADLVIAFYMFLFATRITHNRKKALIASLFVLFNPAIFYNSAYWGQVDAIPIAFLLSSLYTLLYPKKLLLSSILLACGILSKQTIIVFLPIYWIATYKTYNLKAVVQNICVLIVATFFAFIPFFQTGNFFIYSFVTMWTKVIIASASNYTTYHAFNFWYLFSGEKHIADSSSFLLNLSYKQTGYLIVGILFLILVFRLISNYAKKNLYFAFCLAGFAAFLFLTRLHERHFEQVLPFLLLIGLMEKQLLWIFIFASIFHFANLYHNWWNPQINILQILLSNTNVVMLLIVLLIFSFCYILFRYKDQVEVHKGDLNS